jgi:hypothetical protein
MATKGSSTCTSSSVPHHDSVDVRLDGCQEDERDASDGQHASADHHVDAWDAELVDLDEGSNAGPDEGGVDQVCGGTGKKCVRCSTADASLTASP